VFVRSTGVSPAFFSSTFSAAISCCRIFVQRATSFSRASSSSLNTTGLRRGCGIGAVRNRQDAAEMLVQAGKILRLFRAGRQAVEIALRGAFQFGSLLVESRDRIRKSALPCFRGAFLQLCAHRLNLRECFETFIHSSTEPLCISNCLRRSASGVLMRGSIFATNS